MLVSVNQKDSYKLYWHSNNVNMRKENRTEFYRRKESVQIWNVDVDNIVISRFVETKSSSKHLIDV